MTEYNLLTPTGSPGPRSTHPDRGASALPQRALQESLHDSRRATFTREFGEVRGIHRLFVPLPTEVTLSDDTVTDGIPATTEIAFVDTSIRHPQSNSAQGALQQKTPDKHDTDDVLSSPHSTRTAATSPQAADPQLRGLIQDFKERQRNAGLVVAASVASAVALTIATITFVFMLAA